MSNAITEMKKITRRNLVIITEVDKWMSELEDRMVDITAVEKNKEKGMKRSKDDLSCLWANFE